jgi:hypothetical protein
VSWRIARVLGSVNRFIPRWSANGKSRDKKKHPRSVERDGIAPDPSTKSAAGEGCDDLLSVSGLLLQDEQTELEKLCREIDQFSQTFKNADRKQCNV